MANLTPSAVVVDTITGHVVYRDAYGHALDPGSAHMLAASYNMAASDPQEYKVFRLIEMES
jgi:hypothetical protein